MPCVNRHKMNRISDQIFTKVPITFLSMSNGQNSKFYKRLEMCLILLEDESTHH